MKMTVNYEWLCDLVQDLNKKTPEEIGNAFTDIGAETEEITLLSYGKYVQLAEVITIVKLNKLSLISVKIQSDVYYTVTDSVNLKKGDFVIFAKEGTNIAGGITIKSKEIEGKKTQGMLLSYEHLNIEQKSNDIIILGSNKEIAEESFSVLTQLDALYTLEIPGNRPDWLSVQGLAQGLSIYFNLPLKNISFSFKEYEKTPISISIESDHCRRYSIRQISGIYNFYSPPLIQKRLLMLGMRSINYLVDISNIVMLETGQPIHAFDAEKIKGSITIRQAKFGEKITLLDENTVNLSIDDLVICDDEKILALAGIMGCLNSGISNETTSIYLESASFNHVWIRRSAKRLGIKTESSLRFEKNVNPELVDSASRYFSEIISHAIPKASISYLKDWYPNPAQLNTIILNPNQIRKSLGFEEISDEFIVRTIKQLGCSISEKEDQWIITPSPARSDLQIKEDIIEEIARFFGYNNIPAKSYRPSAVQLNPEKSFDEKIRPLMRGMGISEAVTTAFRSSEQRKFYQISYPQEISIINPLNLEWTEMRTHLFDGLLESLKHNFSKAFEKNIALSEIASVFSKKNDEYIEEKKLAFVIGSEENSYQKGLNILNNILKYSKLENISAQKINPLHYSFLHPLNSFEILWNNSPIGFYGEIHPELLEKCDLSDKKDFPSPIACELMFEILSNNADKKKTFTTINERPPIFRDITLSIPSDTLGITIKEKIQSMHPHLKDIEFISVFENKNLKAANKKNLSLKLRFESSEIFHTEEIDQFIQNLITLYNN